MVSTYEKLRNNRFANEPGPAGDGDQHENSELQEKGEGRKQEVE